MLWRLKRFQKRTLHGWQISLDSKFSSVKNLLLIVSFAAAAARGRKGEVFFSIYQDGGGGGGGEGKGG